MTGAVRARERAAELGISECELVASRDDARWLETSMAGLLHALTEVGRCMALTRNEDAVLEVRGRYGGVAIGPHAGQVVGDGVDLRVFLDHWRHAFAIDEPHPQRDGLRRRSLQIFDGSGTAVHKVYLEPDEHPGAWEAVMRARFATTPAPLGLAPAPARAAERPDSGVDVAALLAGWDAMQDTHEFFHLVRRHEVTRTQALRLAGPDRARRVAGGALAEVLLDAAETATRIMLFVGNRGCIQIFSGAIQRVARTGPWLNVLDREVNLHLREDRVASSWVVRKPTRAGVVTSLELYDAAGDTIAQVFRERDDRERAEDAAWSQLLARLPEAR